MNGRHFLFVCLSLVLTAAPAASLPPLFGKKKATAPDPSQRVPELLGIVKSDKDEHNRAQAAGELRRFDAKQYPDIVPTLIEALMNDPKPSVRAEAAQSLGRLRPISLAAGQALEQALARDTSMRVRLQARSALLQYQWSGYRSLKKGAEPAQTKEPPLAGPGDASAPPVINTTPAA